MVKLTVDDKELEVEKGLTVLQACLDNHIYVPHLCYLEGMDDPPGSCRLCWVDIEEYRQPMPSCRIRVREGMVVRTNTEHVRRLQRAAFELLLSTHTIDCRNCPANRRCELQHIAKILGFRLKLKRFEQITRDEESEQDHPFLEYVPTRCVLCGRCIYVCRKKNGQSMLSFAKRGLDTVISFFGEEERALNTCNECYACVEICPVAALLPKNASDLSDLSQGVLP